MSLYLLDTNTVSLALRGRASGVPRRLAKLRRDEVGISVITLMELRYGASLPGRAKDYHRVIDRFVAAMPVHPLGEQVARTYGELRAGLRAAGASIGPMDTIIAAHALSMNAVLVTNNRGELHRVPGLTVEDWVGEP